MPKKKPSLFDPVARRLSFHDRTVNDNGDKNSIHELGLSPNGLSLSAAASPNIQRRERNVRPHQEVTNYSVLKNQVSEQSNYITVFVYVTLAIIATFFILQNLRKLLFTNHTGILTPLCWSAILGLFCTVISWMVTFSDSLVPGSNPPSPMSPQKVRARSGHTFHSSYAICLANGVITFAVCFWYFQAA